MAIKKIHIEEFLAKAEHFPVLDVRSPAEFSHAQIKGAYSIPLFSDEERKVVGTAYKQQGRQKAIKFGLDYFGSKMRPMVDAVEKIIPEHQKKLAGTGSTFNPSQNSNGNSSPDGVLVHCWRGGMRSAGVAWLLDLYGFDVYTLIGGYKAYRKWVLQQFEKDYPIKVLGGYTGSGKTAILHTLKKRGENIIDLEGLANHKGSAFGGIGMPPQPSAEMFENLLAHDLWKHSKDSFWLEDESQRIGAINIPLKFWQTMRTKPVYFVDLPFHERLRNIQEDYGNCDKEKLLLSIERIQKRLGPLETKNAKSHLMHNEIELCFGILLIYYDKLYEKALQNRENIGALLNKIPCLTVDNKVNTENLLLCATSNT